MDGIKAYGTICSTQRQDDGTTGVCSDKRSQIVDDPVEADPTFGCNSILCNVGKSVLLHLAAWRGSGL